MNNPSACHSLRSFGDYLLRQEAASGGMGTGLPAVVADSLAGLSLANGAVEVRSRRPWTRRPLAPAAAAPSERGLAPRPELVLWPVGCRGPVGLTSAGSARVDSWRSRVFRQPAQPDLLHGTVPPAENGWGRWAQWFLADRSTRSIGPGSALTMPDYVNRCLAEGTVTSLREAVMLAPTNRIARARLAEAITASEKAP